MRGSCPSAGRGWRRRGGTRWPLSGEVQSSPVPWCLVSGLRRPFPTLGMRCDSTVGSGSGERYAEASRFWILADHNLASPAGGAGWRGEARAAGNCGFEIQATSYERKFSTSHSCHLLPASSASNRDNPAVSHRSHSVCLRRGGRSGVMGAEGGSARTIEGLCVSAGPLWAWKPQPQTPRGSSWGQSP